MSLLKRLLILFLSILYLPSVAQNEATRASDLVRKGNALFGQQKFDQALLCYQKALPLRKRAFGAQSVKVANVYENIANCYQYQRKMAQAEQWYRKSLAIRQLHPPSLSTDSSWLNFAVFWYEQPRYDSAAVYYQEVVERQPPNGQLVDALRGLGLSRFYVGNHQEALRHLQSGVEAARRYTPSDSVMIGHLLKYQGYCLEKMGDRRQALSTYQEALRYLARSEAADVWRSMGDVYSSNRKNAEVDWAFNQAQLLLANSALDLYAYASLCSSRARHKKSIRDYASAVALYEEALQHFTNSPERVLGHLGLGACLLEQGKMPLAVSQFKTAATLARVTRRNDLIFEAGYALAQVSFRQNQYTDANRKFQALIALVNHSDASLYQRSRLFAVLSQVWRSLARKSLRPADWHQAINWAKRAGATVDQLSGQLANRPAAISLEDDFDAHYTVPVEAWMALGQPRKAFEAAEKMRLKAAERAAREALGDLFYLSQPGISRLDSDIIGQLQQRLTPAQTMLSFHYTNDSLLVFVVKPDQFVALSVAVAADDLRSMIADFFKACSTSPNDPYLTDRERNDLPTLYRQTGYRLYRLLLGQAADRQLLSPDLLLIPSAEIGYVPFGALLMAPAEARMPYTTLPYLAKAHNIGYWQSAAQWLALQKAPTVKAPKALLAMAPVFENWDSVLTLLHFNRQEARRVAGIANGSTELGSTATRDYFQANAADYRILHLATHAMMRGDEADSSFVAFSALPGQLEAAKLYAADIYALPLSADLVVLSACQTALGRQHVGEGLLSLGRAFQYAGVRCVTASLWNVDDVRTPGLMACFYENLTQGCQKSAALAGAQNRYLASVVQPQRTWWNWWRAPNTDAALAHPFYWAGFAVMGDDRPLDLTPGLFHNFYRSI